ncbi:DUF6880 family protein [Legionella genomosp. 1]|uniref:DUF6880 family protein n=1 Tax=Legionella genomosp. 1 TaxID=1093625 RepID=UPI0010546ECB|nr:DUF6880 family protein [Legionella genomosp. 1]
MSKAINEKLNNLSKEALIEIIVNIANENSETRKLVTTFAAAHDPNEIYKTLNKGITSIKNGKRFISYYEANAFTTHLDSILTKVNDYLATQAPDLAIKLCKRFIEIDEKLFERIDDSNGCLGNFYLDVFEVLDKAFSYSSEVPQAIADYILSIYFNDAYGNRGAIVDCLKLCLTEPVIKALETTLPDIKSPDTTPELNRDHSSWDFDAYMHNHRVISIHKKIADKLQDVDRYIELIKLERVDEKDICNIAKRLNAAFRSEEAISWLKQISDNSFESYKRDNLLIEAYMLEGDVQQAKNVLWNNFKKNLAVETYFEYLKLANDNEKELAIEESLQIAKDSPNLASAFKFLQDIQEFDAIEQLYFAREEEINGNDYSIYRKLSTELNKQGKSLIATLLRRKLVEDTLSAARSKSYKYAASDLKLASEFAANISDWRGYPTHADFLSQLRSQHARKISFWSLINNNSYK